MLDIDSFQTVKGMVLEEYLDSLNVIAEKNADYSPELAANFLTGVRNSVSDEDYLELFFQIISDADLIDLMKTSDGNLEDLEKRGFVPAPELLKFLKSSGSIENYDNRLERIVDEIESGGFDNRNLLHKEIEYMRFGAFEGESLEKFVNLPFRNKGDNYTDSLDRRYCRRIAKECVGIYNAVLSLRDPKKASFVIGNSTYGMDFVVELIAENLEKNGIVVFYSGIPSTGMKKNKIEDYHFYGGLLQQINLSPADVFFVDGTREAGVRGKTRFPAAMWGALDYFMKKDEIIFDYHPIFWSPDLTDRYLIGESEYAGEFCNPSADNKLYLMNSVAAFGQSSYAYYDDIAGVFVLGTKSKGPMEKMVPCFTAKGYAELPKGTDKIDYTKHIQGMIKEEICKLI